MSAPYLQTLLERLSKVKSKVVEVRMRAGLSATTPVLDRVEKFVRERAILRPAAPIPTPPPAPTPTPTPTPASAQTTTAQYGVQTQVEEYGIEAR